MMKIYDDLNQSCLLNAIRLDAGSRKWTSLCLRPQSCTCKALLFFLLQHCELH